MNKFKEKKAFSSFLTAGKDTPNASKGSHKKSTW